jgi:hypothetical protein
MQNKWHFLIFASFITSLVIITAGCVSSSSGVTPNETPITTVKLNVCLTDPRNADLWINTPVNLWDSPELPRTKITGKLAACQNISVTVLTEKGDYLKIKSGNQEGWILRETVMG